MTVQELETLIQEIVVEELDLEPGELEPTGSFVDEYDADSLTLITVVARIEKQLGIRLPQERHAELTDLAALVTAVRDVRDSGSGDA
ncbi:acyl carrier protein [Streptomyces sp. HPF1205]|uniref:acyl carrier protein n=1 Tax=Streptomyces sp. HPF1205 TaxID=2873262 RepID=UPI001CECC74A|nr:acyl carrier protein [Streptomyces sp. HPF1205]